MLITFSGLDGAGKSTLIAELKRWLGARGHGVTVLTMYDDVSAYSYVRRLRDCITKPAGSVAETASGVPVPSPSRPARVFGDPCEDVSDKTGLWPRLLYGVIRSRALRRAALMLDLISLFAHRLRVEVWKRHILITDRYLYDTLADVADRRGSGWWYIRLVVWLAPTPTVPVFVDVPAAKAYERKHEYSVEYMEWRRAAYRRIFGWVPHPLVLANENLDMTVQALERAVEQRMP